MKRIFCSLGLIIPLPSGHFQGLLRGRGGSNFPPQFIPANDLSRSILINPLHNYALNIEIENSKIEQMSVI